MNKIILILTLTLATITVNAQNFLDNLRKKEVGKGTVTVVQAADIDSLVNGKGAEATRKDEGTHVELVAPKQNSNSETKKENISSASTTTTESTENTVIDNRKKVMRNSYKMQGYRIQVFSGGNSRQDRQKAEAAGAMMKSNFPSEPIYVHFYSPSWKCRMGNYKTAEEARALLAKVKKLGYNQACIVKGTISVAY